jgi:uncharacterized membrane protein
MSEKDTARVEAFSDGVFAIALTLLILEIRVPHLGDDASNAQLGNALLHLWPSYLAFLLSFGVVLTMWINHHEFMRLVQRADARFLFANGFLLLIVTFVPFPTALLAEYIGTNAANAATAFYCGTFLVANIAFNTLLYSVAHNRRLVLHEMTDTVLLKIRKSYQLAFLVYLLSFVVALFHAIAGLVICSSLWILWASLGYRSEQAQPDPRLPHRD